MTAREGCAPDCAGSSDFRPTPRFHQSDRCHRLQGFRLHRKRWSLSSSYRRPRRHTTSAAGNWPRLGLSMTLHSKAVSCLHPSRPATGGLRSAPLRTARSHPVQRRMRWPHRPLEMESPGPSIHYRREPRDLRRLQNWTNRRCRATIAGDAQPGYTRSQVLPEGTEPDLPSPLRTRSCHPIEQACLPQVQSQRNSVRSGRRFCLGWSHSKVRPLPPAQCHCWISDPSLTR